MSREPWKISWWLARGGLGDNQRNLLAHAGEIGGGVAGVFGWVEASSGKQFFGGASSHANWAARI